MAQTNSLRVRSVNRGPICYLELQGTVDESFDPSLLLGEAKAPKVILNLRSLSRLTSFGVREWTNCMRELCNKVERVYLVQCSPAVVSQLNMVANFAGTAHIVSVNAPFYCELCGWETEITCNIEPGKQVVLPEVSCEQCTANMTFDDDPASYFAFPRQATQGGQMDLGVAAFLRQLAHDGSDPSVNEPTNVVGPEAVPVPSRIPHRPTQHSMPHHPPRPPSFFAKARPILIGLAIPTVVAVGIVFAWPTADALPTKDKNAYESDLLQGRYDEAYELVERLDHSKSISQEKVKLLKNEIVAKALQGYGKLVAANQFEEAAGLVQKLSRDKILAPEEGTRLHKEIIKAAEARYRELAALRQYADAEAVAKSLESPKQVLPPGLRATFSTEIGRERDRILASLRRDVLHNFQDNHYAEALAAAKEIAIFGPLDSDVTFAVAESNRKLNRGEKLGEK